MKTTSNRAVHLYHSWARWIKQNHLFVQHDASADLACKKTGPHGACERRVRKCLSLSTFVAGPLTDGKRSRTGPEAIGNAFAQGD